MIPKEIWLFAITSIRHDAAMYLSKTCDINTVFTELDRLEEERPPRVKHTLGEPLVLAKKRVIEDLRVNLTEESIQHWLDDAEIELTSASFENE